MVLYDIHHFIKYPETHLAIGLSFLELKHANTVLQSPNHSVYTASMHVSDYNLPSKDLVRFYQDGAPNMSFSVMLAQLIVIVQHMIHCTCTSSCRPCWWCGGDMLNMNLASTDLIGSTGAVCTDSNTFTVMLAHASIHAPAPEHVLAN